jgi:uncharacterized lipoprotein
MKIIATLLVMAILGCSGNTNTNTTANDSTHVTYDASKADTTTVPNGVSSGNPESDDTSAMHLRDTTHK